MNAAQTLLQERERILRELAAIESLLQSRFDWKPQESDFTERGTQHQPANPSRQNDFPAPPANQMPGIRGAIHYAREADEWLKTVSGQFSAVDFRDWLKLKYGDSVNESSVKGPFKALERDGRVTVVQQGAGRRPTYYRLKGEQENA